MNGFGGFFAGAVVGKMILDRTKWAQSVDKIKKDEKELSGAAGRIGKSFKTAGKRLTLVGGAIVGTLGMMVKSYVKAGDEVHKMALRTGFATETLSELRYAAEISGADISMLEKGVKKMAKSIVDANRGLKTYQDSFNLINLRYQDLLYLRATAAQEIFGKAGTQLLPLFNEGVDGMEALRQKAHELGMVFDQEAADKAARLADAQTTLKGAMQGLTIAIAENIVPVLSKFIEGLSGVISKISDWMKANPFLASTITKVVAVLGGLMTVLGPMLIILPKLVAGMAMMKGAVVALAGPVGILTAALGALAIGYLKVKDAQKKAQEATERAAELEDRLFAKMKKAADMAGLTEQEFLKLRDAYNGNAAAMAMAIKKGKEGEKLQEALAKVGKEHAEEIEKQKEATDDYKSAIENALKPMEEMKQKQQTWTDYLKETGIQTLQQKQERVEELTNIITDLDTALKDGKISEEDYTEAVTKAREEIELLSGATTTWGKVLEDFGIKTVSQAKQETEYLKSAFELLQEKLKSGELTQEEYNKAVEELETRLKAATNEVVIMGGQLAVLGQQFDALVPKARNFGDIAADMMPPATQNVTEFKDTVYEEIPKTESVFTQVSQRIKDAWTWGLKDMLSGAKSFKDVMKGIWGTVKEQFFTIIAQMISKWTIGFIDKIISGGEGLLGNIKSVFSGVGDFISGIFSKSTDAASGAAQAASDAANGVVDSAEGMSKGFLSNIAKIAGPVGIGLLVGKMIGFKNISKTVQDAWKAASEVVIGAIQNIGKVSDAVFGAISDIVGGIGKAVGGLLAGIGGLLGSRDKGRDLAYWLKLIWENSQNILNQLVGFFHAKILHMIEQFRDIKKNTLLTSRFSEGCRERLRSLDSKASSANTMLGNINKTIKDELGKVYKALTSKGTIYVNMTASQVIESMTDRLSSSIGHLKEDFDNAVRPAFAPIADAIRGLRDRAISAQRGAVLTEPQLVMTHGTPSAPEFVLPAAQLNRLVSAPARSHQEITINNEVVITGTIISDREYARQMLIPEIVKALDVNASEMKRKFRRALGVA